MTSRDFAFWLQGYFEILRPEDACEGLTQNQCEVIQNHLSLVFVHEIDPSYTTDQAKQEQMNQIHVGVNKLKIKPSDPGEPIMRC